MGKRLGILTIMVLLGAAIGYWYIKALPDQEQSTEKLQDEQIQKSDFSQQFEPDERERQLMRILPECKMPVKNLPPIIPSINDHLFNCTSESKEALILETGLACSNEFRYDEKSDSLLSVNWCDYTAEDLLDNEEVLQTFQCRGLDHGQIFFGQKLEESYVFSWLNPQVLPLIKEVLKAGLTKYVLLDDLVAAYTAPRDGKTRDPDTEIMMEQGALIDKQGNSFIALSDHTDTPNYFSINGQLWNPFIPEANWSEWADTVWDDENSQKVGHSHRYFGGFRENVPLVKRLKNYRYHGSDEGANYSTYTLETCELKI